MTGQIARTGKRTTVVLAHLSSGRLSFDRRDSTLQSVGAVRGHVDRVGSLDTSATRVRDTNEDIGDEPSIEEGVL